MRGERRLRPAEEIDPIWRLWQQLPPEWRGPVIGDGIDNWMEISENEGQRLNLAGLPDVITAEMAWMAHWQAQDGTRAAVLGLSQLANILRRAIRDSRPFPPSIRTMDWPTAEALQGWYYTKRWHRLPDHYMRRRLRVVFGFPRLALIADATTVAGGSWTSGTHDATRGSLCPRGSRWPTTAAHRATSAPHGSARRQSGGWARCWSRARCAGPPSARRSHAACSASTSG